MYKKLQQETLVICSELDKIDVFFFFKLKFLFLHNIIRVVIVILIILIAVLVAVVVLEIVVVINQRKVKENTCLLTYKFVFNLTVRLLWSHRVTV